MLDFFRFWITNFSPSLYSPIHWSSQVRASQFFGRIERSMIRSTAAKVYRLHDLLPSDFFIFIFFNFVFYKNIFLFSKFTGMYPGRSIAGRQGLFCKKICGKFASGPWRTGRPAAGRLDLSGRPESHLTSHMAFISKTFDGSEISAAHEAHEAAERGRDGPEHRHQRRAGACRSSSWWEASGCRRRRSTPPRRHSQQAATRQERRRPPPAWCTLRWRRCRPECSGRGRARRGSRAGAPTAGAAATPARARRPCRRRRTPPPPEHASPPPSPSDPGKCRSIGPDGAYNRE